MRRHRIVKFNDGTYGVQIRRGLFWADDFVDLRKPGSSTWPCKYPEYCRGTREQAEAAALVRFPSWEPV